MSVKALVFHEFGGPEVLHVEQLPDPAPASDEVLVRVEAIGLNFADIYRRRGNYHLEGKPPYILGYEGAGVVVEAGAGAHGFKKGDRVAFADVPHANAELVRVPADRAIPLPEGISFEQAAAVLLQGLTAHYLVNDSCRVAPGDEVLVHAAAGGVGQLLVQLAAAKGARVLGLTSSAAKRQAALQAGADEVLLYGTDWVSGVRQWSVGGEGVGVAYDSVGSTLMESFAAVRTRGTVVFYGMAGGDPAPVDPRMLMDASKTLTGGDLWNHVTTQEERIRRSGELFGWIMEGSLKLADIRSFALADGADAHRLLESRLHSGKIVLIP
ncbi:MULTISPECIES: quinone oxidoreductase [unclassified Paenibacillus]|uniref:quinone oxidoreductase family protein n=1 Tax=unclassified Paenibacillus TaxID=185978 RepID=UPI000956C04C|nr:MULTISPECIES: quinone oxidoreductase [unclassified Paenibacillus]SIR30818.1 NADPH2:quinone reductase [Paenibacillus sp. RU4X]SIR42479.1 NADPH2:quinone reductase [Paenibacillus sp. RU4T]